MPKARTLLPLWFMLPATAAVALFFLVPVVLTFVFSFTTMSSDTGILGSRYVVTEATLRELRSSDLDPVFVKQLESKHYAFDAAGLEAVRRLGLKPANVAEIERKLAGKAYQREKALMADLKALKNRPRLFKDRKAIAKAISKSIRNREFFSADEFRAALAAVGITTTDAQFERLLEIANTSWKWSIANYRELWSSQFTPKILFNTGFYVFFTLFFNVGFALVLALITFYMPEGQSRFFRALWLIPRISPSVIYVMLWKWFSYDKGFMSYLLGMLGVSSENWLLEYPWTFVIIINGCVGASMGMIIFGSALQAIPRELLYAAEVDGAYPWQQVRRVILPLLAWPILFITSYQTLSLLTSFEYILLATNGGPGFYTTETWALNAYHTALSNYFGNLRYGYGATLAVVLVAIGIALSLFYFRFFKFRQLVAEPRIEA